MQKKALLVVVLLVLALVACAGCTIHSPPPQPTPVPTTVPTTELTTVPTTIATTAPTPTPTRSTIPEPTQEMPPQWPLSISVEKAGTYSMTVITHLDGGKGLYSVLKLTSRVTQPDGTVTEKSLDRPKMGDVIEIEGSKGADRVEVIVLTTSGDEYKIIDQQLQYKSRQ
ncbi:MAG: hypothetical protein GYA23_02595 [Methanomicrobiales archaeon]|nr:hypothetical protein [Methanomicrobiales archaeon]